jgi:methionyl-tRNA synthetase
VQPFMPQAAANLLDLLAIPAERRDFAALGAGGRIAGETKLPPPMAVFPRYIEPAGA